MDSEIVSRMTVRDAEAADVPVLTAIKENGTEALHRDRLRDAQGTGFRYLVLLKQQEIIGFACLVFLHIAVEPLDNPRAYTLYLRLGYEQIQSKPYQTIWEFQDSEGKMHRGEAWIVDLVKQL